MRFFGFKGGVHPPENKIQTENQCVELLAAPKMVYVPLLQHIGVPLMPIVKIGDTVLKGEKIGESEAFLSVPIHSPVSGTVKKIETNGTVQTVVIENDEKDEWIQLNPNPNWQDLSKNELLAIIKEKGIVGLGGATFPTHIKLNPPADSKIETLILNGAECEPYLNSDNRVMIEYSTKVVEGIKIMKHILNVDTAIIGIEDNKQEAIDIMTKACEGQGIEVVALKTMYPQGGEKSLMKAILNKEVPCGQLPASVGVVVNNTTTCSEIYEAVVNGKPITDKVVTVTGKGVTTPKNIRAVIGTPVIDLLNMCNYQEDNVEKLIMGGPMMGMAISRTDMPIVKGTSGILALTAEETNYCKPKACIICGKCVDVCPMFLEPLMYARLAKNEEWDNMKDYNVMECIECGSCAYICPANRPLTESIKIGKAKLRAMKK